MEYTVTFAHFGTAKVIANSPEEAFAKVEGYGKEDIDWADDFEATDAQCDDFDENIEPANQTPSSKQFIVELSRYRMENMLKGPEIYSCEFIVDIPIRLLNKDPDKYNGEHIKSIYERMLRNAAFRYLISGYGPDSIRSSCQDFNWGDFAADYPSLPTDPVCRETGVYIATQECIDAVVKNLSGYAHITVNQDERLLPVIIFNEDKSGRDFPYEVIDNITDMEGHPLHISVKLIAREKNGNVVDTFEKVIREVDFSTGYVDVDDQFVISDDCDYAIDFGNGVEHRVALSQDKQNAPEVYFWMEF